MSKLSYSIQKDLVHINRNNELISTEDLQDMLDFKPLQFIKDKPSGPISIELFNQYQHYLQDRYQHRDYSVGILSDYTDEEIKALAGY